MKKIAGFFVFMFLLSLAAEARGTILYRVQVGAYKREEAPKDIRKVPKLKKYVLPEGYYCFFSGGYFFYYEGANRQLEKVKELGYENARIRVYKGDRILSDQAAEKYVLKEMVNPTPIPANQKVDKQIFSIDQKRTLENRIILFKEITQPKDKDSLNLDLAVNAPKVDWKMKLKGLKWGKKKGSSSSAGGDKDKRDLGEEAKKEVEEEIIEEEEVAPIDSSLLEAVAEGMVEEKAEEIIEENDDQMLLPENFKVDDIPFFKIYLASSEKGKGAPRAVEYVPDIVYTYEKRDMTLYAVGYFKTSAEAQADLDAYKRKGFYNAKIIAIYKTIVVSQSMGDEILKRAGR